MARRSKYALARTTDKLSADQLYALSNWRRNHDGQYFTKESFAGVWFEMNARGILALRNASAEWDTLGAWLAEVPEAQKLYEAVRDSERNWIKSV